MQNDCIMLVYYARKVSTISEHM